MINQSARGTGWFDRTLCEIISLQCALLQSFFLALDVHFVFFAGIRTQGLTHITSVSIIQLMTG